MDLGWKSYHQVKLPFILWKKRQNPLKMGPKNPLSLLKTKTIAKGEPLKKADNTIGRKKYEENSEIEPIGGQTNFAQEPSDLAINGPDPIGKSQSTVTCGGYQR